MHIVEGYKALAHLEARASVVGIGVFDGVHLGHRALLKRVVGLAQANDLRAMAYTFAPHPARLFAPERAPHLIEPLACRLERFEALGIEVAIVEAFDSAFAQHTAQAFVTDILQKALDARHVVVGAGFAFGHKQTGRVAHLVEMGAAAGFETHPVSHVHAAALEVSSTKVRGFVRAAQPEQAAALLGRPFMLIGQVVKGAQRGTQLGFPTANLRADNELQPAHGVYAAYADGAFGRAPCIVNIGTNPTFESAQAIKVEAHLYDYEGASFYDTPMRLHLTHYIRAERKFAGVPDLITQIQADVLTARALSKS